MDKSLIRVVNRKGNYGYVGSGCVHINLKYELIVSLELIIQTSRF